MKQWRVFITPTAEKLIKTLPPRARYFTLNESPAWSKRTLLRVISSPDRSPVSGVFIFQARENRIESRIVLIRARQRLLCIMRATGEIFMKGCEGMSAAKLSEFDAAKAAVKKYG